jgi:hypothetical protein
MSQPECKIVRTRGRALSTNRLFLSGSQRRNQLAPVRVLTSWLSSGGLSYADELITSDDYLLKASTDADLYGLRQAVPKPWLMRLLSQTTRAFRSI